MDFDPVNAYDNLLDLLEREAALYRTLLPVLQVEKDAIVGSNLGELEAAGKEKEALLLKVQRVEEQRQMMMMNLAESLGCSPHDLTITKLAELVEEPYPARFKRLCSDLLPLAESIRDVNDGNKALIRHSIGLVKSSVAFLSHLLATDVVYYRSGKMQQNDQSGKVLSGSV